MFDNIMQVMSPPETLELEEVIPARPEKSSAVNDEIAQVKESIRYVGARSFPRKKGGPYNVGFLNTYMPPNEDGQEYSETGQYGTPLLSAEQEYFAFRKMNYLKFAALQEETMMDMQSFLQESLELREILAGANMALVKYVARIVSGGTPFYDEILSEGCLILSELIESYEPARERRFIDYAAPKLKSRLRNKLGQLRRVRMSEAPTDPIDLDASEDKGQLVRGPLGEFMQSTMVKRKVNALLSVLDPRERIIITKRFNLDYEGRRTLKEIGEEIGLTRERIRQIETEALEKLKAAVGEEDESRSEESQEEKLLAA